MPNPFLHLDKNPEFIADLHNEALLNRDIREKWGCSNGYVGDRRARIRKGLPIEKIAAEEADGNTTTETKTDGSRSIQFIRSRPVTLEDARDWIRASGDDPEDFEISVRSIAYGHDQSSNFMQARPKQRPLAEQKFSLANFYAESSKKAKAPRRAEPNAGRGVVSVIADWQIGKSGRRGGTPELLERLEAVRDQVEEVYQKRSPERILIPDIGDGIENFESGGNPHFTNDLSLPDQLDCYSTELWKFVAQAARYAPVDIMPVVSNHSQWRRGKTVLGRPKDDFGIYVHREVAKRARSVGLDATWHFPDEWDESNAVDFMGANVGAVHGSQFGPGKAIDWWEKQAFGAQAVTRADVLLVGHYHTFHAAVAGTNPVSGRERFCLGAPTIDSGSDHYRQTAGRDSEPGMLVFDVTPRGFDLSSLTILQP